MPDSIVYSDSWRGYNVLDVADFKHFRINHSKLFADKKNHINGIENFWSLLKRSLGGTYVAVAVWNLFRYVDEQAWRFNNRKQTDAVRFAVAMKSIVGRRLTWNDLTTH